MIFCFDGDGWNIYIDPEFKTHNKKIEGFLKENNIIITLKLVNDISDTFSKEIIIQRNFLLRTDKILRINGEVCKSMDFSSKLKEVNFSIRIRIDLN